MRRHLLPLGLLLAPSALAAQLPNGSTRALGLGGAYTVSARGYEAVSWNPAALALRGRPGFTIGLPQGHIEFGSTDLGFGDFRKYADKFLSDQDKQDILAKIDTALGIRTIGGVTPFGLSIGNFGLAFGVAGNVDARLGKDAVELALFGNASNPAKIFSAAGSRGSGWSAATAAASYAMPIASTPLGRISVGVTGKYIWGAGLARGNETQSSFQLNPAFQVHAAGHAIYTEYDAGGDLSIADAPGHGFGLDLGGTLEMPGGLVLGASITNIIGSMTWDNARFRYERADYAASQNASGQVTDVHTQTTLIGSAIDGDAVAAAFRDSVLDNANFSRVVRVGAGLRSGKFLLSADAALRLSDGLDHPPGQFVSAGAEYVLLGLIPLRIGAGTDFANQFTFSGGTGLYLGPVHLEISGATITGSNNPGARVGAGLSLMF